MQKKEIKRRRTNNKKSSTTRRSTSNTKNIKKRVTNVSSKEEKQAKLIFAIVFVAIVLLCYFTLGTFFALLTGVGIAIIIGVAKIIPTIPKKCSKINNPIIIVTGCNFIVLLIINGWRTKFSRHWTIQQIIIAITPVNVDWLNPMITAAIPPIYGPT